MNVEVVGCEETPCDVVKGTTAVMYVHFVGSKYLFFVKLSLQQFANSYLFLPPLNTSAKNNIKKLNAVVHATTLGITVPYDLPEDVADVCSNLMYNATCPIDRTEDVVYAFNFYVDAYYPEISVSVQISLEDEDKESIACFICNIRVRKGATNTLLQLE